jgi:hypothetical protein
MVNKSEQPINTVMVNGLKDADKPEPKWQSSWIFSFVVGIHGQKKLPVNRLDLTHHVTYAKHGKPVSLPNMGRKAARPNDGGAGRGGWKKRMPGCNGLDRG